MNPRTGRGLAALTSVSLPAVGTPRTMARAMRRRSPRPISR